MKTSASLTQVLFGIRGFRFYALVLLKSARAGRQASLPAKRRARAPGKRLGCGGHHGERRLFVALIACECRVNYACVARDCSPCRPLLRRSLKPNVVCPQPRQIIEIKQFLLTARRPDAKSVKIKKSGSVTKFKVRCSRLLYTLCVEDQDKADKLKQSLPPGAPRRLLVPLPCIHVLRADAVVPSLLRASQLAF